MALDKNFETFVVYIAILEVEMSIYPSRAAHIAALQWDKAFTEVPAKYSDYADIFSTDLAIELPENTNMNKYTIKLIEEKQPSYGPIYALNSVELETLKAYIETHLKTRFIQPSKFPTHIPILFDKTLDGSLCLCVDYRDLNNLTIKNWYPLLLIDEVLDRLCRVKRFTQLDLTNAYHRIRI